MTHFFPRVARPLAPVLLAPFLTVFLAVFAAALPPSPAFAAEGARPLRIAYLEAGEFWLFKYTLKAFQEALAENADLAPEYVEHLSPGWDAPRQELVDAARALMARDDIDLIIAAGTSASRVLQQENNGRTPVIGVALADPVAAGLVASVDDSGIDNFTCRVIPNRWENMFRVFYDVIRFKRLGLIYPKGPEGKLYAAVADAEKVSRELGFEVLAKEIEDENTPACTSGVDWLKENGADAFFIGPMVCFDWDALDPSPLLKHINEDLGLPTFARDGSAFVQGGALMGFASWDFGPAGRRLADMAARIAAGARPRDIPMKDNIEPLIAVNLETAMEVGVDLPIDVLIAADEIYETTSKPSFE
ncbi:MAG: ABC transporter substrate-binding protein [Desulfovibrionaceae bacterium]